MRRASAAVAVNLGWMALAGCAGDDPPGTDSATDGPRTQAVLVDMAAWDVGSESVQPDPLPDHRPVDGACPPGGTLLEGAAFEIQTGTCTYAWFQQPSLTDVRPGDVIEVVFWHAALVNETPAQGHLALFVGDDLLYEKWVDIPHDPAAYTETAIPSFSAPAGTPVTLHVHNHGANNWDLLRVERQGVEAGIDEP